MRLLLLLFWVLLSMASITAQPLPLWYRVYTFDESTIEMNTSLVTFISRDVTRVRFRWSFNEPQALSKGSHSIYQTELEVMELNCSLKQYRSYHRTFYDAAGNIVLIQDRPEEWRYVTAGSMTEKLFIPACDLVRTKTDPAPVAGNKIESERVARYAYQFIQHLERTKDFKLTIDKFFAANYLDGYLQDGETNRFVNLDRNTAAKVSRQELQRYYVALMNAVYLSSLYLISVYPEPADRLPPEQLKKLIPSDIWKVIKNHPYTAAYQKQASYDFLAEKIDTVKRLKLYTDLLEGIGLLMRRHVNKLDAEHSKQYQEFLDEWNLFEPKERICTRSCLGLPAGTKLFVVRVPMFRLELAEIRGNLKVVSATSRSQ